MQLQSYLRGKIELEKVRCALTSNENNTQNKNDAFVTQGRHEILHTRVRFQDVLNDFEFANALFFLTYFRKY